MLALQALCAYEALGDSFDPQLHGFLCDREVQNDLELDRPVPAETIQFASTLARGAWGSRAALDRLLEETAQNWALTRMTPVDRNILRLGLYELHEQPDTPPQVVISEAVELARRFGDAESPGFVNGVLDAIRRARSAGDKPDDESAEPSARGAPTQRRG
jgi:N utilization substance protein B